MKLCHDEYVLSFHLTQRSAQLAFKKISFKLIKRFSHNYELWLLMALGKCDGQARERMVKVKLG